MTFLEIIMGRQLMLLGFRAGLDLKADFTVFFHRNRKLEGMLVLHRGIYKLFVCMLRD